MVQPVQSPPSTPPWACALLGYLLSHRAHPPDRAPHTRQPPPTIPGPDQTLIPPHQPCRSPRSFLRGLCQGMKPVGPQLLLGIQKAWRRPPGDPGLSLSLSLENCNHSYSSSCHTAATLLPETAVRPASLPHHPLHRQAHVRPQAPESLLTAWDLVAVGSWGATEEGVGGHVVSEGTPADINRQTAEATQHSPQSRTARCAHLRQDARHHAACLLPQPAGLHFCLLLPELPEGWQEGHV